MKILILTGRYGMGHYRAAIATKENILNSMPEAEIEIIDITEYLMPMASKYIYGTFEKLVTEKPDTYNLLCRAAGKRTVAPFRWTTVRKIGNLIKKTDADCVISTLHMCSQYVGAYKKVTGSRIPLITVITDISDGDEWLCDETDYYMVAADSVKEALIRKGVNSNSIIVSGIPVSRVFLENREASDEKAVSQVKNILIMGGGLGLIPGTEAMLNRFKNRSDIHITVITGKNEALRRDLSKKYPDMTVIGYTNKVDIYMRKADLLISKAGGITLFEAIRCHTPICVLKPFLLQEIANAEFIEERSIGKVIDGSFDNEEAAREIIKFIEDRSEISHMKHNMSEIDKITRNINVSELLEAVA